MEQLGIEPTLLGAQVINFLVILFVLNKLLYKPILSMIEKRKKEIAEGLELTESLKEEEARLAVKQDKALEKAREEALGIIDEAKKQAKDAEKDILLEAHNQAQTIINRAREEAGEVEKEAQARVRKEAVNLALIMSERVLSSIMNVKEQHAFIAKQTQELTAWAEKQAKA